MEGKISRINNTTDLVIDRISSLPGFILGHILSFLPTKEAVATSILSKRWNFAWVTVHNLDFDHDAERARHTAENTIFVAQNMKFVRFVDRVLLLHDYGSLNKFSLEWHWGTISSHVSSWIKTAITRNVRELHLSLGGDGEGLRIPALGRATISLSTKFKRLVELEVKKFCSSLQDLIQSSCNLEALRIFQVPRLGTSDPHDLSTWNALVEVPRCLSNSLKKVYFGGYKGLEDEREMIRYMLEHGSALEVMQISCYIKGDGEKIELLQEVCEFPRKSPVCKVQFSVWPTKREFKPLL